jgi:signal transduction histidine kinase
MHQQIMQVLLVESNTADAALVRQAFSHFPQETWQFTRVETFGKAIEIYQHIGDTTEQYPFDLVLLDLDVPDAKGLETIQQFLTALPETPVILLSEVDDTELALQAIEQGVQDYLVKSQITLSILLKSIQFAIRRQCKLERLQHSARITQQALTQSKEINQQQINFVGMVSHEIKNPLGTIQMSAEMMYLNLEGCVNTEIQKLLGKIHLATSQMNYLLDDILALCRLQAEKPKCKLSYVQLCNFCTELVDEIQQTTAENHFIEFSIQEGLSYTFSDIQVMRSIFTNLLSNAVKYSPEGGVVRFEVTAEYHWMTFLIQDTGIGIPEADQAKLFENFYRASNVSQIPGTGLGLAIVHYCVSLLRGKVEVESTVNLGTTFKVKLPLIMSANNIPDSYAEVLINQGAICLR